jgi:hypothetical protein
MAYLSLFSRARNFNVNLRKLEREKERSRPLVLDGLDLIHLDCYGFASDPSQYA